MKTIYSLLDLVDGFSIATPSTPYINFSTPPNASYTTADGSVAYIWVPLPGIRKEGISVEVQESLVVISITGERTDPVAPRVERWRLNDKIDFDNIRASYENGLLKITLPYKQPKVAARQIAID